MRQKKMPLRTTRRESAPTNSHFAKELVWSVVLIGMWFAGIGYAVHYYQNMCAETQEMRRECERKRLLTAQLERDIVSLRAETEALKSEEYIKTKIAEMHLGLRPSSAMQARELNVRRFDASQSQPGGTVYVDRNF